ncbi:transmembrane protease serine 11B-like isoform X2 [Diabrotica virgifera virgifera]|uniref:Peptidase S1 domain-containing protein n=1 Tax=Diabrotica virgifera virgifera TaxID=50390 RepID=A0ABM5JIV7_DIAVI|nr:transmembrane protease serine 11B-like isoform X2 [Diabrotica virgifera virgifera]
MSNLYWNIVISIYILLLNSNFVDANIEDGQKLGSIDGKPTDPPNLVLNTDGQVHEIHSITNQSYNVEPTLLSPELAEKIDKGLNSSKLTDGEDGQEIGSSDGKPTDNLNLVLNTDGQVHDINSLTDQSYDEPTLLSPEIGEEIDKVLNSSKVTDAEDGQELGNSDGKPTYPFNLDTNPDGQVHEINYLTNQSYNVKPTLISSEIAEIIDVSLGSPNRTVHFHRIINGQESHIENHPWIVALTVKYHLKCGGCLISAQWVVTAAHCIPSKNKKKLEIRGGNADRLKPTVRMQIDKIIKHEKFTWKKPHEYDIAVIKNSFKASKILMETEQKIIDYKNGHLIYTDSTKSGANLGDSGGPLEYNGVLLGIVSGGDGRRNRFIYYTEIAFFRSWIKSKTGV